MSQQAPDSLSSEVRFKVPLPIVIPLGALLLIGAVTIGLSQILLSVPKEIAVVIAIAVAANVLIAGAIVAQRPETARSSWAELLIVFLYPIVVGLVIAQLNIGEGESAGEQGGAREAAEAAGGGGLTIGAESVAFTTDEIVLPAQEEARLEFSNDDSVQHNVAIYEEEGGESLFEGQIIPGGQSVTYEIPPLDKGEYYFQCDVHPSMNGTAIAE